MTYARARLWTGIFGVGSVVVLAIALLAIDPSGFLRGRGGAVPADFATLWALLACLALLALPLDIAGGFVLPKRYGRPHPAPSRFAAAWLRGVGALITISALIGAGLLAAGRWGGTPAALAAFAAASLLLVAFQEPIARLVGGLRRVAGSDGMIVLRAEDPAFSGGFHGRSIVLPEPWTQRFEPRLLERLKERRRHIRSSGARARAVAFAVAWNTVGFLLATLLPSAGVGSVAELVMTALGFSLWTFLGLLVLPTPSRRATFAMDALAAGDEAGRAQLAEAVRILDKLQDDEPERAPGVETIFHPIPSVSRRIDALHGANPPAGGAWNLARTALYLAHAGLSPLPRVVHCNAGRPELWVYLPTDG